MAGSARPVAPLWTRTEVAASTVLTAVGMVTVFVASWRVAGTATVSHQIAWVGLGLVAVGFVAAAGSILLTGGRRAIGLRMARLVVVVPSSRAAPPVTSGPDVLVAGSAMTMFHRADCALVRGKQVEPLARTVHEQAGRRPCGICVP